MASEDAGLPALLVSSEASLPVIEYKAENIFYGQTAQKTPCRKTCSSI